MQLREVLMTFETVVNYCNKHGKIKKKSRILVNEFKNICVRMNNVLIAVNNMQTIKQSANCDDCKVGLLTGN